MRLVRLWELRPTPDTRRHGLRRRAWILPTACALFLLVYGCSSRPPRIVAPKLDPVSLVDGVLQAYDSDNDDSLSSNELKAAPGIFSNLGAYDLDHDGAVSRAELEERFEFVAKLGFGLNAVQATVEFGGVPLEGATVTFEPASFFQEMIKPATGITNKYGVAVMGIADDDLPAAQQGLKGVHTGTYLVRITHPDKSIPAKYNSDTTLGYEPRIGDPLATFNLSP